MTQLRAALAPLDVTRVRRAAGLVAAGSMSLYLLVKVVWIVSALVRDAHPSGWGTDSWIGLNAATVGMALVGVACGLALAQPWGQRLPAVVVVAPVWVACGFLISMLPFTAITSIIGLIDEGAGSTADGAPSADMPGWESVTLGLGFAGMAVGLLVGVPLYARQRWPGLGAVSAFPGSRRDRWSAVAVVAALSALAAVRLGWAVGLEWGVRAGETLDADDRALVGTFAGWCLLAALAVAGPLAAGWIAAGARAVLFVASGALTAWGSWVLVMRWWGPAGFSSPLDAGVAAAVDAAGVVTGLLLLRLLLRSLQSLR